MKEKSIQIPESLFLDLCKFHLLGVQDDQTAEKISASLKVKMDAIEKRSTYTQYKTGADAADREAARQKYLDKIGVPENFRY